jgi:uncharacterized membrane protein
MTDGAGQTPPPIPPYPPQPPVMPGPLGGGERGPVSEKEIADGKVFAILSYVISLVGFPFWLVPLIMRDNAFSLYHAKQCFMLFLTVLVGVVICVPLVFFCVGIPLAFVLGIGSLVLHIMGAVQANQGLMKPVPIVGVLAERWFAGIQKKAV